MNGPRKYNRKKFSNARPKGKWQNPQSSKVYQHQNQLREGDVGITQFISKLEGYSGVIKARFSDFQVNEIDLNGDIAKLTDQQVPPDFHEKVKADEEPPAESPLTLIPQDKWDDIKKIPTSTEAITVDVDVNEATKEERTQVHECLQKAFGGKVCANTVVKEDRKIMTFKKHDGKSDRSAKWPKDKGEYVHFLVYKECLDTLETTLKIASCLKIAAPNFTYAGVKDKRAKTTQWFSVRKVEPWKLIIKTKPLRNVRVGNITFKDEPLKLGDLSGNKFRIALRNVTGSDELIDQSLQSLKEKGFINYYGLQRFGNNKEVPTFSIGVQLLLGNWKEACQIILKATESDRPDFDVTKAKKVYAETGNASKALEEFDENRKTCIEYLLLTGLSKENDNDYVNALSSIPRNTRLLYIHSFQSLVWNTMASKRIEQFGLEVVEGDLVIVDKVADEEISEEKEGNVAESKRIIVKALTLEECSNYSIYDIVLPLPGYDVTYPKHLEQFYKETLEKYGLTLEMTQQKVKEYSVSGTYRKLMGKVQNLSWKIMHYDDPNYNLIRSDLEELKGMEEPKDVEGGTYKALVLEFCLDSSSYATMVLREILKIDTSSSSQANLNSYHAATQEQKKLITGKTDTNENTDDFSEKIELLNDAKKFEAFKNFVFNEDEPTLKRKHEDEDETENAKVAKVEENGS